jgi:hypothetical protein
MQISCPRQCRTGQVRRGIQDRIDQGYEKKKKKKKKKKRNKKKKTRAPCLTQ